MGINLKYSNLGMKTILSSLANSFTMWDINLVFILTFIIFMGIYLSFSQQFLLAQANDTEFLTPNRNSSTGTLSNTAGIMKNTSGMIDDAFDALKDSFSTLFAGN